MAVVIVGMALLSLGSLSQGNVSTGGFIIVGPFPIVFGAGAQGGFLALLSVVLGLLMIFLLYLGFRKPRRRSSENEAQNDNT